MIPPSASTATGPVVLQLVDDGGGVADAVVDDGLHGHGHRVLGQDLVGNILLDIVGKGRQVEKAFFLSHQ